MAEETMDGSFKKRFTELQVCFLRFFLCNKNQISFGQELFSSVILKILTLIADTSYLFSNASSHQTSRHFYR